MSIYGDIAKKPGALVYVPGTNGAPAMPARAAVLPRTMTIEFTAQPGSTTNLGSLGYWTTQNLAPSMGGALTQLTMHGSGSVVNGFVAKDQFDNVIASSATPIAMSYTGRNISVVAAAAGSSVAVGGRASSPSGAATTQLVTYTMPIYSITVVTNYIPARPATAGTPPSSAYTFREANVGWNAFSESVVSVAGDLRADILLTEPAGCFVGIGTPGGVDIEHGVYISRKTLNIAESYRQVGFKMASVVNDTVTIIRIGTTVHYELNGVLIHTSTVPSVGTKALFTNLYAGFDALQGASLVGTSSMSVRGVDTAVMTAGMASGVRGVTALSGTVNASLNGSRDCQVRGSTALTGLSIAALTFAATVRGVSTLTTRAVGGTASGAMRPMSSSASDKTGAGQSANIMLSMTTRAVAGLPVPRIATSTSVLSPMSSNAEMLTGYVGQVSSSMAAMYGLSGRPYGESAASLPVMTSYGHGQADSNVRTTYANASMLSSFSALRQGASITIRSVF